MELLIYATVFALIVIVTTSLVLNLNEIFEDIIVKRELDNNLSTVVERITRDIKGAKTIDLVDSVFVTYPGVLSLTSEDESENTHTYKYYLSNGVVKLDRDGVYIGDLTSDRINITDFKFYHISTENSDGVRITITGEGELSGETITKNYYGLGVLRN